MKSVVENCKIVVAHDKSNKPIHCGDWVRFSEHVGKIVYNESQCRFEVKWEDGFSRDLTSQFASKSLEVVK